MTRTTSLPRPRDLACTPAASLPSSSTGTHASDVDIDDIDGVEGWQALAVATHGRLLSAPELSAAELLPVELALDLLFPTLGDAARHEAMWALDRGPE